MQEGLADERECYDISRLFKVFHNAGGDLGVAVKILGR
jgi:hypothetical protein